MRGLYAALAAFVTLCVSGCGTLGSSAGNEARDARLPTGSTLLASDAGDCEGIIQLRDGVRGGEDQVGPGQNATFRVTDNDIEWSCLDRSLPDSDTVDCPDETEYLRITRGAGGDDVLFECYG